MGGLSIDRLTTSPRAANWGYFSIDVDTAPSYDLLARAMASVSETSLLAFLKTMASPYFADEIIDRFAYEGDDKSGHWKPLEESTVRIRRALGYPGSNPINERTGELMEFVAFDRDFMMGPGMAGMDVPGKPNTASVEHKLKIAQHGSKGEMNPMMPGAETKPRPVLATGLGDMEALLKLLEIHIMERIAGSYVGAVA